MQSAHLVDSHLHLQDYPDGVDLNEVISQSTQAGVAYFVCNGTSENDWAEVLNLADAYPGVVPCLGLHPWFVAERSDDWLDSLECLVSANKCGIGEIGLDRLADPLDKNSQEEAFVAQLELAQKYNRPVMVHCVKQWGRLMDIMRAEAKLPRGMLFHAYGGSAELVRPLADMGAYFTFSGTVLKENRKHAREALLTVPPDRLLIESDAPNMLPPEPFRLYTVSCKNKEYNHPANLPVILKGIAELLGRPVEQLSEIIWENSQRFLRPILEI